MDIKLKGRFLDIEKIGNRTYKVLYVTEGVNVNSLSLHEEEATEASAKEARDEIEKLTQEYGNEADTEKRKWYVLWPEMFIEYKLRRDLGRFFVDQSEDNFQVFNAAFSLLEKSVRIRLDKRRKEINKEWTGGLTYVTNRNPILHQIDKWHRAFAPVIGEEVLDAFERDIKHNCGLLEIRQRQRFNKYLGGLYENYIKNEERFLTQLYSSEGRNDPEGAIASMRGVFEEEFVTTRDRIDEEIDRHNLETRNEQREEPFQQLTMEEPDTTEVATLENKERLLKKRKTKIDLGRTKLDDVAEYIVSKIEIREFADMKDACIWVSKNCKTKGNPVKYASIYRTVSEVKSRPSNSSTDHRKKVEEFEKKFGIESE